MSYQFTNVSGATVTQHVPGYNNDVWAIAETRSIPDSLLPFFRAAVGVFSESAGGGSGSTSSPFTGCFAPSGWNTRWKAAREAAKLGGAPAILSVEGDSVTYGYYASNLVTKTYVGLLRAALQAYAGDGGSGTISGAFTDLVLGNDGRSSGVRASWAAAGNLATLTGTWTEIKNGTDGPGFCPIQASTVGASYTHICRGRYVDIYYQTTPSAGAAGSFTYQIDGGSVSAPISSFHATQGNVSVVTVDTGSANSTSHTVVITATDANGTLLFTFCALRGRGTTGIIVDCNARGGSPSNALNNVASGTYLIGGTTWGGSAQNLRGGAGAWNGGSLLPADLAIYVFGLNDAGNNQQNNGDTWLFNLRGWLEDVKNGNGSTGTTSIIVFLPHPGTIEAGFATTRYYSQIAVRARAICEAYNACLLDYWPIGNNSWNYENSFGNWGNPNTVGVAGTDLVHRSDAGHLAYSTPLIALALA